MHAPDRRNASPLNNTRAARRKAIIAVVGVSLLLTPGTPVPCGSLAIARLLAPQPASNRASFTWTGGGSDDDWDTTGNWGPGGLGYPDDLDDATIPDSSGAWQVNLITVTIDDLAISGDVNFSGVTQGATLTMDSGTIVGPAVVTNDGTAVLTSQ